jgi:hypothetical protein
MASQATEPVNPTSPNFLVSDPREIADLVAEAELATAIAWTRFYLDALKDRQNRRMTGQRRVPEFHRDAGERYPDAINPHKRAHPAEESQLAVPPLQDPQ